MIIGRSRGGRHGRRKTFLQRHATVEPMKNNISCDIVTPRKKFVAVADRKTFLGLRDFPLASGFSRCIFRGG